LSHERGRVVWGEELLVVLKNQEVVCRNASVRRKGIDNVHGAIGRRLVHEARVHLLGFFRELESVLFAQPRVAVGPAMELGIEGRAQPALGGRRSARGQEE